MLTDVLNFLEISPQLGTAGQPTADQFQEIAEAGYQAVINLSMPDSTGAIANEAEIVQTLGMQYIHLPVAWDMPRVDDLRAFFQAVETLPKPVFIHCAMNMRVSVFVYLYRTLRLSVPVSIAKPDLEKIWLPNPVWQEFIARAKRATYGFSFSDQE